MDNRNEINGFFGLGIAPAIMTELEKLKFNFPTPIQSKAIPAAIGGSDIAGIAQTGTGKTIAFSIPMLQRMAVLNCKGLILVPTRELASQVEQAVIPFAKALNIKTTVLIGGEDIERQIKSLSSCPALIIATPGRLIDHLERNTLSISDCKIAVLDEADRMLDMGFIPQVEKIFSRLPKERQTMLFSATMPEEIMNLASQYMKMPLRVEVAKTGTAPDKIEQELFFVSEESKMSLLNALLEKYNGSVLLFIRTRHQASKITSSLKGLGYSVCELHSDKSLGQRTEALDGFKKGKYRILVATDIASRGIDVEAIELVINYDLPDEEENYIHRIGRTGRAGKGGKAVSFVSPDQINDISRIEKLLGIRLKSSPLPPLRPLRRTNSPSRLFSEKKFTKGFNKDAKFTKKSFNSNKRYTEENFKKKYFTEDKKNIKETIQNSGHTAKKEKIGILSWISRLIRKK
ncbi:MAG: DEAD/DEAH box helicase [Elusimicrobiota bacterium]